MHAETDRRRTSLGLCDPHLVLAPGDSAVLEWRLVGTNGNHDAWIEGVRAILGSEFRLEGGFAFGSFAMIDWPPAKLREWITVAAALRQPAPPRAARRGTGMRCSMPGTRRHQRRLAAAVQCDTHGVE